MLAIRGATTVANNTSKEILDETKILIKTIISKNNITSYEDIISITFSVTTDLTAEYPAKAVRDLGITDTPLFCTQEMNVENSLEKCIRVLIYINKNGLKSSIKHIYLNKAEVLRRDLID